MATKKSATGNAALKDPTDQALLAMESNLDGARTGFANPAGRPEEAGLPNVEDSELFAATPAMSMPSAANEPRGYAEETPSYAAPPRMEQQARPLSRENIPLPRSVANDDRRDAALTLAALNRRPSGMPILLATLGSLIWLGMTGYNYYTTLVGPILATSWTVQTLPWPELAIAGLILIVPVIAMFVLAGLYRRSAEMKNTSRVMADVAMRLAQPETIAADQVATLSQAIRRELASLGDGIERSLGRAGELETMVHREVTALERSYSDNETRIRTLVDELVNQREAIHTNAERVRIAIVGAHDSLTNELAGVGTRVADSVSQVGATVAQELDQRRDEITQALSQTGEAMLDEIAARSNDLIERLSSTGLDVSERISTAGGEVTTTLNSLGQRIVSEIESHGAAATGNLTSAGEKLVSEIAERGQAVTTNLQEVGGLLRSSFEETSQSVSESLAGTGETIIRSIVERSQSMNNEMRNAGDMLIAGLGARSDEVTARLDDTGTRIAAMIAERGDTLAATLDSSSNKLQETLSVQGEGLQGTLSTLGDQVASLIAERAAAAKATFDDSASRFVDLMDERAQGANTLLADHVHSLESNLRITAEESTSRLADAAREVVIAIATQGGRVNEALAQNAASLANSLNQQSDLLGDRIANFEQSLALQADRQTAALDQHTATLEQIAATRAEAASGQVQTIARLLADQDNAIVTHFTGFEQGLQTHAERHADAIQRHAMELEEAQKAQQALLEAQAATFQTSLGRQNDLLETRIVGFEQGMDSQAQRQAEILEKHAGVLRQLIERGSQTLAENALQLVGKLNQENAQLLSQFNGFENNFKALADRQAGVMQNQISVLDDVLQSRSTAIAEKASAIAASLGQQDGLLDERISHFEQTLALHGERQTDALQKHTGTLEEVLQARAAALDGLVQSSLANFEEQTSAAQKLMDERDAAMRALLDRINGEAAGQIGAIEEVVLAGQDTFRLQTEAVSNGLKDAQVAIARKIEDFAGMMAANTLDLSARLGRDSEALTTALEAQISEADRRSLGRMETFAAQLTAAIVTIETAVQQQTAQSVETLRGLADQTADQIQNRALGLHGTFNALIDKIDTDLSSRTAGLTDQVEAVVSRVDGAFAQRSKALNDSLTTRTLELEKIVGEGGRNLTGALDITAREIDARMASHVEAASRLAAEINAAEAGLANKLSSVIDDSLTSIEQRGTKVAADVSARIESATAILDLRGDKVTQEFVERINIASRDLEERGDRITQDLAERIVNASKEIESRGDRIANGFLEQIVSASKEFEERGLNLASSVSERMGEAAEAIATKTGKVDELLKNRVSEIDRTLLTAASEIARALGERSREIKDLFDGEGQSLVEAIDLRGKELRARISEVTDQLDQSIGTSAERAVGTMKTASETLRGETSDVLGRLSKANELLNVIMVSATTNLGKVENELTGKMSTIADTMTDLASSTDRLTADVAARVENIRTVSAGVLAEANQIATSLENRTKAMVEASNLLTSAQNRINDTLEDKQHALGELVDQVSSRSQNLEAIIRSFTSLVDESMRNAETRARQVGAVLAEQSQLTVEAITDQYDSIRSEGAREHERTVAGMREVYEDAMAQAGTLYEGLGTGLQSAMSELREATAQIRAEVEAARAELKRGAAELPREAEAATAAVRRIVSDQVKALSELSEIVNKANRGLDVSEPRYQAPRTAEARTTDLRRPAPPAAPLAADRSSRSGRDRNGWLSELLSRASDEPAAAPPAPIPSRNAARNEVGRNAEAPGLDNIVNEIGRMIDESSMLDAWDRYRRGERTAFGRRLYTPLGQQTFEEIRRRYRRDTEFRDNVDVVVDQFDSQLRDITASDRNGVETDRFLSSDAGKVYTLLAHASGRLD